MASLAFFAQLFFHTRLRRDARVVGAWKPENGFALLTGVTSEQILQGVVEDVTHVKYPGHVRRRDDDGVSFFFGRNLSAENPAFLPFFIPGILYLGRTVARIDLRHNL